MKTLEDQLAAYGKQRSEGQAPFTTEDLNERSALHGPIVSSDRSAIEDNPESTVDQRVEPLGSRSVSRRLTGWQVGVAVAAATLLGFGLINVFAGGSRPADVEGTLGGPTTTLAVGSQTLAAGRNSIVVNGVSLSFDIPATGWESYGDFVLSKTFGGGQAADAVIFFAIFPDQADALLCPDSPPGRLPETSDLDVVAESIASRLASTGRSTGPGDFSIGGLRGKFVEVEPRDDAGCDPGFFYGWTPPSGGAAWTESKPGDIIDAWFVNVDGVLLVIVAETRGVPVRRAAGHEIFQFVDSIRFPSIARTATADYVIDMNTGETTLLPAAIRNMNPFDYAASPDGSMLAYVAPVDDGSFQLFTAGIDGADISQITHPPTEASSPAWSPDGSMLAYVQSGGLFVLDVATGESTQIPNVGACCGTQFTPDGSSILYAYDGQLWTVPIEGGSSTVIIGRNQGVEAGPGSLSPDGSLVTFMGNRIGGPGAIRFLADTDGSEPQELGLPLAENCGWTSSSGTWSPDGTRIVCGQGEILVVDVATEETSIVAEGKGAIWLDDHTLLVEAWGE